MAEANPEVVEGVRIRRERKRIDSITIDKTKIAERIQQYYVKDQQERGDEIEARLQRYAKFRMWREGKDWPWEGATDSAIPDMMTASMRMQDTLHNAVMSSRPPIMAKAQHKSYEEKTEKVTNLIDFQLFEEQPGEDIVGQLADDFVNEGLFTAYTPWITETRRVREIKVYDPLPEDMRPVDHFLQIVQGFFPRAEITPTGDGWDFKVQTGQKRAKASFYTKDDGRLELDLEREVEVFNGPRAIRKDLQDVLHPARCENLQIRSPSNPMGAQHVIVRDYPTIDEIKRLATPDEHGRKHYDLITEDQLKDLENLRMDTAYQQREEQKDVMQGHIEQKDSPKGAESHHTVTRLRCYDSMDINGDGLDEDSVVVMILENKAICRAHYLSEEFPSDPPRRPFAEGQLFPVPGRRLGIGMLEMMEGLHDLSKQFFDQGGDAGTLANAPFGFYRAASNMRPEVIRMWPGEMYPLTDPKNDVHFPTLGNPNQAFTFNMLTYLNQIQERLTTIGDLQVGRVPQGKASALRTVAGMQTVLAQGDARPERVLRRFFMGLTQIFQNFHSLNEVLLPPRKQFVMLGPNVQPGQNPYEIVESATQIKGKFRFTFSANVLNTSKEALQASLQDLMTAYISPLAIQLGIIKPDGVYRLLRDWGRSKGPDPDKYLSPPASGAQEPPIDAETAILAIIEGVLPQGSPMEGTQEHMQKLMDWMQSEQFGYLEPQHVPLFRAYLQQVQQLFAQEQAAMALANAAQTFGKEVGGPGTPGPAGGGAVDQSMPQVQGGELADETLPGAGGGGNAGVMS